MDRTARRQFIFGALSAVAASSPLPAEREIRTAHIGIGNRGSDLLGQVLQQSNSRVLAICDIDPNARDRAQAWQSEIQPSRLPTIAQCWI